MNKIYFNDTELEFDECKIIETLRPTFINGVKVFEIKSYKLLPAHIIADIIINNRLQFFRINEKKYNIHNIKFNNFEYETIIRIEAVEWTI